MGNELLENCSADIMYKSFEIQRSIYNNVINQNTYTFFNRHNEKILENEITKQNGFVTNTTGAFLKSFNTKNSRIKKKVENKLNGRSNGILICSNTFLTQSKANNSHVSDIIIVSDDSTSMNAPESNEIFKNNNADNAYKSFNKYKERKLCVRLKKINLKITKALQAKQKTTKKKLTPKKQTIQNKKKWTNLRNVEKRNLKIKSNSILHIQDDNLYSISNGRLRNRAKLVSQLDIVTKNILDPSKKKISIVSQAKPSSTENIKINFANQVELPKENHNKLLHFETIYVDTVNIDDTNSESSPLFKEHINKSSINKNYQIKQSKTKAKKRHILCRTKESTKLQVQKSNHNKISKRRKKNFVSKKKRQIEDCRIKNCKISVKNLNTKQLIQVIRESSCGINHRRRSWSASDVAREHDRRLNFFPEAGPSHIDYYALIKLPVVKPKVPINYY